MRRKADIKIHHLEEEIAFYKKENRELQEKVEELEVALQMTNEVLDAKEEAAAAAAGTPDFLSQALNEGDGSYKP